MNPKLIVPLFANIHELDPPGCVSEFVDHPNSRKRAHASVEVGFMLEHRFAFYFWTRLKRNREQRGPGSDRSRGADAMPPDLVTWDWHDDCGADSDVVKDKLKLLNQADEQEVAMYCWAGLHQLNDGHILPALWLNALGNVYIVQKQKQACKRQNRSFTDRYGREHRIFYFRSLRDFPAAFERTNSNTGVAWDIDLDYFTQGRAVPDKRYTPTLSAEDVASALSPETRWMPLILRDLKLITIALEPTYTGGLDRSLELYRRWESALFTVSLFSERCRWRKRLTDPLV